MAFMVYNKFMNSIITKLSKFKNKEKAKLLSGFFKTGVGEYGEGDIFWGINVPEQRKIAKEFVNSSFNELQELLKSGIHECRLTSLLILTYQYEKLQKTSGLSSLRMRGSMDPHLQGNDTLAAEIEKKQIFDFYIKNIKYINNWDLVDVTCHKIVGAYLFDKDRSLLYKLANSKNLWEKRIAIISTFYFIREKDFTDSLKLAEILLRDKHDLIHKAIGWTLREVGKKDEKLLHAFLKKHSKTMPRTALRYSIERIPEEFKKFYVNINK
jgi:3-methyladenine DNA glycosylase AlkD